MTPQTNLNAVGGLESVQRVEDTCWWWGTRWQYGWRGYGWYPCWDSPNPSPTVVAPEALPESLAGRDECIKKSRDSAGMWHAQKVC